MTVVLIVVAVVLVGCVAGAGFADRAALARAERTASAYLSAPFGHPATVRVTGRPFLTQALRGCYRDVEVSGGLRVGEIAGATLAAHLTNVYLPLRDLVLRQARELPCEHVEGRLVLPYDELSRVARLPGLVLSFDGERLMATVALPAALNVPGIGQFARITGQAVLSLAADGAVWLRIRDVAVAGIGVPSIVLNQILPSLSAPIPLPPPPYGLRLTELRPTATGLVVDGSADAVVFRAVEPSPAAEVRRPRPD